MKLLFVFLFLLNPIYSSNKGYSLDYIYVNANTGQSSGGHTAIKLGNLVYHFQFFPDKVFHIVREPWEDFRFVYGIQENRTIFIRKIKLSKGNYDFFLERMNEIYLIQKKELENLARLENDTKILESIIYGDKSVYLKATGYFSRQHKTQYSFQKLKSKINSSLGNNYLLRNLNLIRKRLYTFKIPQIERIQFNLEYKRYPTGVPNFSSELLDLLSLFSALEVLFEEYELNPTSYIECKCKNYTELNDKEVNQLKRFASSIENEIMQLLQSNADNRGYPLLVLTARYLVIQKTITNRRFYFLESFGKKNALVIGEVIENKTFLTNVNNQISKKIDSSMNDFFKDSENFGQKYTIVEDAVNRQREILDAWNKSIAIRINYELMIPEKEENIPLQYKQMSLEFLKKNLESSISNKNQYIEAIQNKYSFNLFNKNCTTEIFRSLNSFFENGESESNERLGGNIKENDFLIFVPVYAYYTVGKKYKVEKELNIPSFRTLVMKKNISKEQYFSLRESSTFTSKYYRFNKEDPFFIFFTDDITWQRPIFGFVNLIAGFSELGMGMIYLPFDKGEIFIKGLQGVFFSGPEILFFNVRKGTFIYEGKPMEEVYE